MRQHDSRLLRIGDAMLRAAAPLCGNRATAGVSIASLDDIPNSAHPAVRNAYGNAQERVFISAVATDRADAKPGLAVGTGVLAIDAQPVAGLDTMHIWRLLAAASASTPVVFDTDRGRISFLPEPACPAIFVADTAAGLHAGTDGIRIRVTTQLLDFAADDAELAAVIAHEVAHFALCHHDRSDSRWPRSKRKREREADRLSARLLYAAGYGLAGSRSFWTRFGRKRGLANLFDLSHGSARGRLRRITAEYEAAVALNLSPDDPALFAPFAGRGACHVLPEPAA